jgi:hypothetical protein
VGADDQYTLKFLEFKYRSKMQGKDTWWKKSFFPKEAYLLFQAVQERVDEELEGGAGVVHQQGTAHTHRLHVPPRQARLLLHLGDVYIYKRIH